MVGAEKVRAMGCRFGRRKMAAPAIALLMAAVGSGDVQSALGDTIKLGNATSLDQGGSWQGGVAPTATDVAIFGSLVTLSSNTVASGIVTTAPLAANLTVAGITVGGVNGGPVLGNAANMNAIYIADVGAVNTLTIGASGIDMSAANAVPLVLQSKIVLSANQTWNISDASANIATPAPVAPPAAQTAGDRYNVAGLSQDEDLALNAQNAANAAGGTNPALLDLGGNTLTKTGAGTVAFNGGYQISNGTINVNQGSWVFGGGSQRSGTIGSNVTTNLATGAILRLQGNNNANTTVAGPLNLADGSTVQFTSSNVTTNHIMITGPVSVAGNVTLGNMPQPITGSNTASGGLPNDISGNITGGAAANLTLVNTNTSANSTLSLSGDNSGFLGSVIFNSATGNRLLRLTTNTAGSSAATWTVGTGNTLQVGQAVGTVAGASVQLGTLNGGGTINNPAAATTSSITVGAGNFSGNITNGSGTMALTKATSGTLTLSGAGNTYTGPTQVNAGKLVLDGTLAAGSAVGVGGGATLTGIGTAGGAVTLTNNGTVGGTLSPGDTTGTLTVGSLVLDSFSQLNFDLDVAGTVGGGVNDLITDNDGLTLAGKLNINPLTNFGVGTYRLINYVGALTDNGLGIGSAPSGFTYQIDNSTAGQVNLVVSSSSVPEPSSIVMMLGGVGALVRRRKNRG